LACPTDADQDTQRERWDRTSVGWDAWFDTIDTASKPVSDRLVDMAGIGPGDRVLDIATGIGEPALTAANRVGPRGHVVGIDISTSMVAGARRRAAKIDANNVSFRACAAEDLDGPSASFDAVLCRWGLMFMADIDGALRRMNRLLRDGGRLAAAAWAEPWQVPTLGIERRVLAPYFDDGYFAHGLDHLNAFRFADSGLLERVLSAADFRDVICEPVTVVYEFSSVDAYIQFRKAVSSTAAALANRYPEQTVETAWQTVAEATSPYSDGEGRIRMENTALCAVGHR
jgi:ubiquinone/menaquinone biosynthesis C-methylase UbiE